MSKLTEQVYRTLRRQIMSGDLAPGSQIKEEHVAAGLGVSRTPVRAAFLRLIEDGLLISRRGRGAFVAELRAATEAMRRCLTEKPLNFLSAIQTANSRFHRTVLEASGSPRLRALASTLVDIPRVVGAFYVYSDSDIERSIQHHLDLQVAIEQRDRALAQEIMSVHLRMAYLVFMRSRRPDGVGDEGEAASAAETEPRAETGTRQTAAALIKAES